jgi:hypothetical protein
VLLKETSNKQAFYEFDYKGKYENDCVYALGFSTAMKQLPLH